MSHDNNKIKINGIEDGDWHTGERTHSSLSGISGVLSPDRRNSASGNPNGVGTALHRLGESQRVETLGNDTGHPGNFLTADVKTIHDNFDKAMEEDIRIRLSSN